MTQAMIAAYVDKHPAGAETITRTLHKKYEALGGKNFLRFKSWLGGFHPPDVLATSLVAARGSNASGASAQLIKFIEQQQTSVSPSLSTTSVPEF